MAYDPIQYAIDWQLRSRCPTDQSIPTFGTGRNITEDILIGAIDSKYKGKPDLDTQIIEYTIDGYTQEEIAEFLKISQPTISRRIKSKKLRERVSSDPYLRSLLGME